MEEDTETQKGEVTCPKAHSSFRSEFESGTVGPQEQPFFPSVSAACLISFIHLFEGPAAIFRAGLGAVKMNQGPPPPHQHIGRVHSYLCHPQAG